jgi:hypothetical protein
MRVMHCRAVKFRTVFRDVLAAPWHGSVVAFAKIEVMIHVSIEMLRTVKPRSRTDEYPA